MTRGLGEDHSGLHEISPDDAFVFALEHLEGVTVTRCYRDNQRLVADWGDVPEDVVLPAPEAAPPFAPDKSVAELVDALVAGKVDHKEPRFVEMLKSAPKTGNAFNIQKINLDCYGEFFAKIFAIKKCRN